MEEVSFEEVTNDPARFYPSLDNIARRLKGADIEAHVIHSGGGCFGIEMFTANGMAIYAANDVAVLWEAAVTDSSDGGNVGAEGANIDSEAFDAEDVVQWLSGLYARVSQGHIPDGSVLYEPGAAQTSPGL